MWMFFLFKLLPKSAWVQKVKYHLRKDSKATLDITLVSGCCETGCEELWKSSCIASHSFMAKDRAHSPKGLRVVLVSTCCCSK